MSTVLCTAKEFQETEFDFIIVGGGTAGLVLAARLTEDPSVSVGVIEAGEARLDDPFILTPLLFTKLAGNGTYDWMMKTVPQPGTNGKVHAVPRGKVLGGSSAINFMIYVRGERDEYDDWSRVSVPGWTWSDLEPYFRKHESLHTPQGDTTLKPQPRFQADNHGADGPIRTSFANWHLDIEEDWHQSMSEVVFNSSHRPVSDAWNGKNIGIRANLSTIDRSTGPGVRSYSATGYLKPIMTRSNLKVLTSAQVGKIVLENVPSSSKPVAVGVSYTVAGESFFIRTRREVLLSAGTIHTPQILELSGIGNPRILEEAGVKCVVENPGVGENLQDHPMTCMVYELADSERSLDMLGNQELLQDAGQRYATGRGGPLANGIDLLSFVPVKQVATTEEMARIEQKLQGAVELQNAQERIIASRLINGTSASLQFAFLGASLDPRRMDDQAAFLGPPPSKHDCVTIGVSLSHPLSQGSVHIECDDAKKQPRIDPAFMTHELDVETASIGLRVADTVFKSGPLARKVSRRVFPSETEDFSSPNVRVDYIRECTGTQYHPVGTAAIGSVVDEALRVHGVTGLRVIDASIFPMHISGNIQATVYAVAEKAADLIKNSGRQA